MEALSTWRTLKEFGDDSDETANMRPGLVKGLKERRTKQEQIEQKDL